MRHKSYLAFFLFLALPLRAQIDENALPLQVTIDTVQDFLTPISPQQQVQAATFGVALPGFVMFRGTINGENHWVLSCRREVMGQESVPCTLIPTGVYRGRWIHDHFLLQIVGGPPDALLTRFLTVASNPKDPAPPDDPLTHDAVFNFSVKFPGNKSYSDYPLLVHVYGSVSLELPVGQLPAQSSCNAYSGTYQTTVNCTASPPIEIRRGYVTVDFSSGRINYGSMTCEAKWRWSHCSGLAPGFYFARVDKNRIIMLTHDSKGDPHEVGFEAHLPNEPALQSPIK